MRRWPTLPLGGSICYTAGLLLPCPGTMVLESATRCVGFVGWFVGPTFILLNQLIIGKPHEQMFYSAMLCKGNCLGYLVESPVPIVRIQLFTIMQIKGHCHLPATVIVCPSLHKLSKMQRTPIHNPSTYGA